MRQTGNYSQDDQLFTALAQQLKVPLLQIARLAEAQQGTTLEHITVISEHALRLVDAYAQSHSQTQITLLLEPITTGAVLYDVANDLYPFAKHLDYNIEVDLHGRSIPVMAHRDSLRAMLTLLGASLIEVATEDETKPRRLILGTHRSSQGTIVGAFSSQLDLSERALKIARELYGTASQVAPTLSVSGGAGLAIADRLSEQMSTRLKTYRHRSFIGIGSLLLPSQQLRLLK